MKTIIQVASNGTVLGVCRTLDGQTGKYSKQTQQAIDSHGETLALKAIGATFSLSSCTLHIIDYDKLPGAGTLGYDKRFLGEIDYNSGKVEVINAWVYDGTTVKIDLQKGKLLLQAMRRRLRARAFAPYDAEVIKCIPGEFNKVDAERKVIRASDNLAQIAIDNVTTEAELYSALASVTELMGVFYE